MSRPKRKPADDIPLGPNPSSRRHGAFTPLGVLSYPGLTHAEKLCLGYLNYCSAGKNHCDVFRKGIATIMNVDVRTTDRILDGLEAAGFIRTKRNGPERPNTYFLLPHPAIEATRLQGEKDQDWRQRTGADNASKPSGTELTEMSVEGQGTELTSTSVQDGTQLTNLSSTELTSVSGTELTFLSTPYKEHKNSSQEVFIRSKQASSETVQGSDREECGLAGSPSPSLEIQKANEPAPVNAELSDAELIREALEKAGIAILGAKPEELLEIAIETVPTIPVEIVAEFIASKAREKAGTGKPVKFSSFYPEVIRKDLKTWLNTADGKAAQGILQDQYRHPRNEQERRRAERLIGLGWVDKIKGRDPVEEECKRCAGSGLMPPEGYQPKRGNVLGTWCYCALGVIRKANDEPILSKGEECTKCYSNLQYHTIGTPKPRCYFCERPEKNRSRQLDPGPLHLRIAELGASRPPERCIRCNSTGLYTSGGYEHPAVTSFCHCSWAERCKRDKGEDWADKQTAEDLELWEQVQASTGKKPLEAA